MQDLSRSNFVLLIFYQWSYVGSWVVNKEKIFIKLLVLYVIYVNKKRYVLMKVDVEGDREGEEI